MFIWLDGGSFPSQSSEGWVIPGQKVNSYQFYSLRSWCETKRQKPPQSFAKHEALWSTTYVPYIFPLLRSSCFLYKLYSSWLLIHFVVIFISFKEFRSYCLTYVKGICRLFAFFHPYLGSGAATRSSITLRPCFVV